MKAEILVQFLLFKFNEHFERYKELHDDIMQLSKLGLLRGNKGLLTAIIVATLVFFYCGNMSLRSVKSEWRSFSFHRKETLVPQCLTGTPCVYEDEVDFRIIVITYNRAESLMKLLKSIDEVVLDGDKAALEIWIDRSKEGQVHNETVEAASSFKWRHGPTRVHIQNAHAGIYGQWIDTWRPRDPQSKELALILEDDISISKYSYRWIKAVHRFYDSRNDFAGTTLTSDEQKSHDGSFNALVVPKNETVFMYKCIGTWGFSPKPSVWREFQDWYHIHINKSEFHPYVTGSVTTQWYKSFEESGTADSMWEQWFIYFADSQKLFNIYNNLKVYNSDTSSCLCINRREVGLHVDSKGREDYCKLLDRWDNNYVTLSHKITKLDWSGKIIDRY